MSTATSGGSLPALLSHKAVLEWLGVSKATFNRWARDGNAPSRIKLGNRVLFRQDQLLAWLDAQALPQATSGKSELGSYDEWR